jgi:hypothetical protein
MPAEIEIQFHRLPRSKFPITFRFLDKETGLWVSEVTAAGPSVVYIPSKTEINGGRPVTLEVIYADGTVSRGSTD